MKIIGLCGFANSGKSTVAKYLIEKYGYQRLSFASAVKDVAAVTYSWDRVKLDGQTEEDRNWRETVDSLWSPLLGYVFTPRMALQQIGQGFRDIVHPDIWVNIIRLKLTKMPENSKVIFDDVRYVNERATLKSLGTKMFVVHRSDDYGILFPSPEHKRLWDDCIEDVVLSSDRTDLHQSEWDWLRDPTVANDPILQNRGSISALHEYIDALLLQHNLV